MNSFKADLLRHLHEIHFFLQLEEANPFKIRAYQAAEEALEALSDDHLEAHLRDRSLLEIRGIGKGIASVIETFQAEHTSEEWKSAVGEWPLSLLELEGLKGLGPKRIRSLYEQLGIRSLGELEYACHENRLRGISNFGPKLQEKILNEIESAKQNRGKNLLADALQIVAPLERELATKATFKAVGDLGRKLEVVESFDYTLSTEDVEASVSLLENLNSASEPHALKGQTAVQLSLGHHPVRFYLVIPSAFATTNIHKTSSPEHWASLQKIASEKKLELKPEGLFRKNKVLQMNSEEAVYREIGLPYHPPEAREWIPSKESPDFCKIEDLRGIFHVHTTYSDGRNSLEEMSKAAQKAGLHYMGLSDHSQTSVYAGGLNEEALEKQWKEIAEFQTSDFRILRGVESDILKDGSLDYPKTLLKKFDFVIASIHMRYGLEDMTKRLIEAIENVYTTMIGHISGRLLLARAPYEVDYKKVIDAAVANKKIIELNASPHRLDMDWRYFERAIEKGLLTSINPDAHSVDEIKNIQYGVWMSHKALIPKERIFNTWELPNVLSYLGKK